MRLVIIIFKSGDADSQLHRSPPASTGVQFDAATLADPLRAFVHLEQFNAHRLVFDVHTQLAQLARALNGTLTLTEDSRQLATALLVQQVGARH